MFSRKVKIVSLMTLGFLIIVFGVVFGLQKFGVVNIKGLADILPQSAGTKLVITVLNNNGTPAGVGNVLNISNTSSTSGYPPVTTGTDSKATFSDLSSGTYNITVNGYGVSLTTGTTGCNTYVQYNVRSTTAELLNIYLCTQSSFTQTYTIKGRVVDNATNTGLSGITIFGAGRISFTNTNGYYTLSNIPFTNTADLTAQQFTYSRSGYESKVYNLRQLNIDPTQIKTGLSYDALVVKLKSQTGGGTTPVPNNQFQITGKIQASDTNTAIVGANISLSSGVSATSGSGGSFTLTDNLPTGKTSVATNQYSIAVTADGYVTLPASNLNYSHAGFQGLSNTTIEGGQKYDVGTIQLTKKIDDAKFDWIGSFKNTEGVFIGDVPVELNVFYKNKSTYKTYTSTTAGSSIDTRTKQLNVNYEFEDIPNDSSVEQYVLEINNALEEKALSIYESFNKKIFPNELSLQNNNGVYFQRNDFVSTYTINHNTKLSKLFFKIYNEVGKPLEAVSVDVISSGCDSFPKISIKSDTNGNAAVPFSDNYARLFNRELPGCYMGLTAKINKDSYITQIVEVSIFDVVMSKGQDKIIEIQLKLAAEHSDASVIGSVKLDSSNQGIANAIVSIWKNNPIENPLTQIKTDSSGNFIIKKLTTGRYLINAFRKDLGDTPKSRLYFDYREGSTVDITLYLDKLPNIGNVVKFPVGYLRSDQKAAQGYSDALLDVQINGGEVETKNFDTSGFTSVTANEGDTILLTAYLEGSEVTKQSKDIKIPDGFNGFTPEQKTAFYKTLIFYNDFKSIFPVRLQVVDGSKKPISNAEIYYFINEKGSSPSDVKDNTYRRILGLPLRMKGISDSQGKAVLTNDFQYIDANDNPMEVAPINQVRQFALENPMEITVKIGSSSYDFYEHVPEKSTDTIILNIEEADNISERNCIRVELNSELDYYEKFYLNDYSKKVYLEKLVGDKWEKIVVSKDFSGNDICFYPSEKGIYRAGLEGTKTKTFQVNYDLSKTVLLELGICPPSAKANVIKYSDQINFAFSDTFKSKYQNDPQTRAIISNLGSQIANHLASQKNIGPLLILVNDVLNIGAYHIPGSFNCLGLDSVKIIHIDETLINFYKGNQTTELLFNTFLHEYGHGIFEYLQVDDDRFIKDWIELFFDIKGDNKNEVWDRLTDGNVNLEPMGFGGHPEDAYIFDMHPGTEMFASFYQAYFGMHNRFLGIIQNNTSSETQNILAYMWQIFSEKIGKVNPDDNKVFNPIGGAIGTNNFTYQQIKSGVWRNLNYQKLSLVEKTKVQFELLSYRAKEAASAFRTATVSMIRSTLSIINEKVEQFLISLGLHISTSSVSGTIVDNYGSAVGGFRVQISEKTDITDDVGYYKLSRLPTGNLPIVVENQRINKKYATFPTAIDVKDDRTITDINIRLTIPKRRIKGRVMLGSKPLSNGYIIAEDGYTSKIVRLNTNGEFLDYLRENMYHLTFRDSNYQIKTIANPGTYVDTNHLKVVDTNLDSMIWVR